MNYSIQATWKLDVEDQAAAHSAQFMSRDIFPNADRLHPAYWRAPAPFQIGKDRGEGLFWDCIHVHFENRGAAALSVPQEKSDNGTQFLAASTTRVENSIGLANGLPVQI